MTENSTALKDTLFNREIVSGLAVAIHSIYPVFEKETFLEAVFDNQWVGRSLMDRMRHITTVLHNQLPADYQKASAILLKTLPEMSGGGFIDMVPSDYAAVYGLDDLGTSIRLLEESTKLTSAEFAVRHFIIKYPEEMMAQMLVWSGHEHPGVRRLASEGCRPRLPWGIRLKSLVQDPAPILPILDILKHDPSEMVRRSVANNLNDISKDHPDVVLEFVSRWQSSDGPEEDRAKMITHALRTLVKEGDIQALELLGFRSDPQLLVRYVQVEPQKIAIGQAVTFSYELESTSDAEQKLMIDYVVYLLRANGSQTEKVFKHRKLTLEPGEIIQIKKKHSFQPVTTRRYYAGAHAIQPQLNGVRFEKVEFELAS